MAEFFKNNPMALRHCILYECLRGNPVEQSFTALDMTVGPGVIKKDEFQNWIDRFEQRIFDEKDDKEPITEMRDVLQSDKYALRACILYESLKYKLAACGSSSLDLWPNSNFSACKMERDPSFILYNNFCDVVGDDMMEYREFDFWFYRFFNGDFDIYFERDTDTKIYELVDIPIDIMENIVEYLDIFDRINLAKASRSLRTFVEAQKLFHDFLKLEVTSSDAIITFRERFYIEIIDIDIGFWKEFNDCVTCVEDVSFWEKTLLDLKSIFKNPKLHLNTLEIDFNHDSELSLDDLENALKSLPHQLNVRELTVQVYSSLESFLKFLPYLKPGYLTTINIHVFVPNLEWENTVFETEQWKQAQYFEMDDCYIYPLRQLYHFKEFNVRLLELSVEDLREMKEVLFKSTDFCRCVLIIHKYVDMYIFKQEFGNAHREHPYIFHYPIPNSKEYFEIQFKQFIIEITRKKS